MSVALDSGNISHWSPTGKVAHSRAEFWTVVDRYAAVIRSDPRIGDFNLIVARTSTDMMALFVAMMSCDRRVSFFPPSSSRQDAAYYVAQQRAAIGRIAPDAILVFDDEGAASLERVGHGIGDAVVAIGKQSGEAVSGSGAAAREAFAAALADPDRLLFWQHSSGTTGIKKAVGVTSAMLVGQHTSYWCDVERLTGDGGVRVASWLPLYHDMGLLATFLMPLLGGADIAILDPFDWIEAPALFLEMIAQERSTITWMPNFAYRHFTRLARAMPARDLSSMRAWVSCSEPVRHPDALAFEHAYAGRGVRAGSVVGCYAMAETVFAAAQLLPAERRALAVPHGIRPGEALPPGSIADDTAAQTGTQAIMSSGRIVDGLDAAIFVEGVARTEPGIYGEIGLAGPFVFDGYRAMSPVESNIRDDGYFLTGDLGAIVDGHVYIFGRSKEIIIVNGKNIYAGDIEDHLNLVDGVKPGRVVAFGIDNPRTGSEDLIVVAERRADTAISADDLTRTISATLGDAFLVTPFDVRVVDAQWLVKSTSGKISRAGNRTKYLEHF